ncbi:MAG TPA: MFS transporter [Stellaceae bacterium]|nr:MFS transporter [Stellaceae bacterium]
MADMLPLDEQTVIARIERLPFSRWHVTVTIILGVAIFFDSFDSLALAYVLPVIIPAWHIGPESIGGLISIANLGQAVGAFCFGFGAERIGRIPAARLAIGLYAVMSFVCAFTHNYDQLFWCRFFEGIGLGGEIPIASTYISEILRAEKRGGSFLSYQMIFPVGLLGASVAGAYVVPRFGWQWMFIIGAVPAVVALVLQRLCPESPRWLASKGRLSEAGAILDKVERIVSRDGTRPLPPVPQIKTRPVAAATRWQELFEGRYRARTILAWVLWASVYIIAYGLQGWIPTLYRQVYHLPLQQALTYAAMTQVGTVVGSLLCALIIDRTGRRLYFIGAFFLLAAGLTELAVFGAATAEGMLIGYFFCAMWLGSIAMSIFLYTAEIYPTRMRAMGVSWASFWLRIAATVGPILVGFVLPRFGIGGVFGIFAGFGIIGCAAAFFMVETSRRLLEEVSP